MKIVNGLRYSKLEYPDYKYNATCLFEKGIHRTVVELYTDDTCKESFTKVLKTCLKDGVELLRVVHFRSKKVIDVNRFDIDELLKGI